MKEINKTIKTLQKFFLYRYSKYILYEKKNQKI